MKVTPLSPAPPVAVPQPSGTSASGSFEQTLLSKLDPGGLKFSNHAQKRLAQRQINFGTEDLSRLNQALDQAKSKGVKETLLIYGSVALVASVENRTVVTALEGEEGKVFTNIDGAVIVPR